ncbi:hypothetical protein PMAYCL1PPCAC_06781 [Pristionchus mayeri]|uniref:Uncharacterized protein n=1 Tax=Pristionchus mayeri TaxID=1317129 RepID=A0AAN4Z9F8_9BILA|nr:hypothetical protein PMAYCL1PPCAC_06781 [Pristionchus mayeri]
MMLNDDSSDEEGVLYFSRNDSITTTSNTMFSSPEVEVPISPLTPISQDQSELAKTDEKDEAVEDVANYEQDMNTAPFGTKRTITVQSSVDTENLPEENTFIPWEPVSLMDGLGWDIKEGKMTDVSLIRVSSLLQNLNLQLLVMNKEIIQVEKAVLEAYRQKRAGEIGFENRTATITQEKDSNCWVLKKRRYLPAELPRYMLVPHNVLFIRHVSRDYNFTETALTMLYSPLNFYCFTVDSNATETFKEKMRFLSLCVHNVIVPEMEVDGSDPEDYFRGTQACLQMLQKYPWEHVVILEEQLVPVRSVQSLILLLSRLNHSSLIGRDKFTYHHGTPLNRTIDRLANASTPVVQKKCTNEKRDQWGNCVKGMEEFDDTIRSHDFFVRVDPSFDFGFVQCMHERVFRKTYEEHIPL